MMLSKLTASVLIDLIENKLAMLQIGDRDDLREVLTLQRCLSELRGVMSAEAAAAQAMSEIPSRGRHKKLSALMQDFRVEPLTERQTA